MKITFRWIFIVPLLAVAACTSLPPTVITEPGKQLFSDSFADSSINTSLWTVAKGDWAIVDGAVKGIELESDAHAAVMRTDVAFEDAVIRLRFKLADSGTAMLSINEEKGHHSRVIITPEGFVLQKDKDKKDPRSLTLPLGRCNQGFETNVWYSMTVEYCGDNLLAYIDEQSFVLGTHDQIHTPKNSLGLVVRGSSVFFDDVSICSAVPSVERAARIDQLRARQAGRVAVSSDPRTAYTEAETVMRDQLMKSDTAFNALLSERIAVETELQKRWPKAFRPGAAAMELKKKLLAEDAEYKALSAKLNKARKTEIDYLLGKNPALASLRESMLKK